jgi:hypothetical protein
VFASAGVEHEAARIVLRGSVEGLSPEDSLTAVASTTELELDVEPHRIVVRGAPQ